MKPPSHFSLLASGAAQRLGRFELSEGDRRITVPLKDTLAGTATVGWRVVSGDGHTISGSFVFHVGERTGAAVAIEQRSMVVVALSGVLGRYLYLQIPRTRAGEALSLQELEAQDRALSRRLGLEFGLDEAALRRLEALSTPPPARSLLALLLGLLRDDLRRGRELRAFARSCRLRWQSSQRSRACRPSRLKPVRAWSKASRPRSPQNTSSKSRPWCSM